MAKIVTVRCERALTTMVNDVGRMESQSLAGISVISSTFWNTEPPNE